MSQKDVKKIVFCSLNKYKAMEKETGSEYIIDAADITEAITNSTEAPANNSQESDFIKFPEFYIKYKIENLPEEIYVEYISNLFSKEVKITPNIGEKELVLDNSFFDFDNIRYNSIHVLVPIGQDPVLSYHNLIIPIKENKLPYIFSQGKKISIAYKTPENSKLDYPGVFSNEEQLDPETKFELGSDGFVTNIFAIKRDPHNAYQDETLHEDKKEAFEKYKQKQIEYFKNAEKKISLDLDSISRDLEYGPAPSFPSPHSLDYSGNSSSASTTDSTHYVNPFEGIPFNKRDEVKVRFRKIFETK